MYNVINWQQFVYLITIFYFVRVLIIVADLYCFCLMAKAIKVQANTLGNWKYTMDLCASKEHVSQNTCKSASKMNSIIFFLFTETTCTEI